ncbi:MAG: TonB-dependent receptor [Muribaculum sp.]|nr:TonB-dependent receptor [Muribaculum sp.]
MTKHVIIALFMLLACIGVSAQTHTVTGTVTDADHEPMVGVSVIEKGSSNGTMTDADGKFTLKVGPKSTLRVSYIGYVTQDVSVGAKTQVSIVMQEDNLELDEVVVVGYGTQKKSDLTGSVSSISADDIKGLATTDAAAALQGKASGVQILNTSGAPGSGANIRIRGYSSNSGELGPLLIVDGLKVDNIQYLDPSMIESMEVLKDAASAAIYGAQAGNGVILITTKNGAVRDGQPKVIYSFKAMRQSLGKTPEIFGAKDWIRYKEMSGYDMKTLCEQNGVNYDNPAETNWIDEVFEPSWSTQHSVILQDGNEKGNFFTSINYVDNDGIVVGKKDTYSRLTAQLNAEYKIYNWIKVGTNTSIERWRTRTLPYSSSYNSMMAPALMLDPLTPVYWDKTSEFTTDMMTHYQQNPDLILMAPNGKYYATSKFANDDNGNPLLQIARRNARNSGFTVRGTGFVDLMPFKTFILTSRFSYRIAQSNSHNYSEPYYVNGQAKADDYEISASANNSYYYQWENFANYNETFGKHKVGAMIGMSYTQYKSDNVSASAKGNNGEEILKGSGSGFQYLDYVLADGPTKSIGNVVNTSTSLSYFGRVMYAYDNRYNIQFNFRADAFDTSKLPAKKRWGKFPSVSAGWTISNESFVREHINPETLSLLKVRASWGRNGNINVLSGYPYGAPISYNSAWYQYGDDPTLHYGSYPSRMANPNLRWETSEQVDFGIDARFFNGRLSVGVDYYNKDTKDLLVSITPIPEVYANGNVTVNAGKVNNRGVELELGWRDRIGDLSYSVTGNLSTLRNRVTYLYDQIERLSTATCGGDGSYNKVYSAFEEGHSIWYFRAFDYAGVDKETGAPLFRKPDGTIVGSTELNDDDMVDIGSSIPTLTYGLTINLAYKGFDFSVFGTGVAGNKIYNLLYRQDTPMRNSLKYYMDNAWTATNHSGSMPDPKQVVTDKNFWSSSASMFSGAYFKIKQIQLGYTVPKNLTRKAFVKDLRFFVSLDDFFTFTKYPGMDPETATTSSGSGSSGYDKGSYPTMKKVTFGATIGF